MTSQSDRSHRYRAIVAWVLLAVSAGTVAHYLSDYQVVWAHPENFVKRDIILARSYRNLGEVLLEAFNWPVWEAGAPRLTRLLSSAADVLDTHFRAWFNAHVVPHPSLSVSWVFVLCLAPLFLYKALRAAGHPMALALLGVSLYLSLPGVLSLAAMGFRPGKAVALFFINYIAYLMIRRRHAEPVSAGGASWAPWRALHISSVLFMSLFADEIAVFSLAVIICLNRYGRRGSFALPLFALTATALYYFLVQAALPRIHELAGFPVVYEGHSRNGCYDLQHRLIGTIRGDYDAGFYITLLGILAVDSWNAVRDLAGLGLLWAPGFGVHKILGSLALMHIAGLGVIFLLAPRYSGAVHSPAGTAPLRLRKYAILFLLALGLHAILMSLTRHPYWGIYWYGAFTGTPFALLVMHLLACRGAGRTLSFWFPATFVAIMVAANFSNFVSTNYAYKDYHYYPMRARELSAVFRMEDNKFALTARRADRYDLRAITQRFLQLGQGLDRVELPAELEYLIHEVAVCPWEFDYYHRFENRDETTPESLTVTCFSTLLPTLRTSLQALRDGLEHQGKGDLSKWVGLYDEGGYADRRRKAYVTVDRDGTLLVVNGGGSRAAADRKGNRVVVPAWKLSGRRDPESGTIIWENGSVWVRNDTLPAFTR